MHSVLHKIFDKYTAINDTKLSELYFKDMCKAKYNSTEMHSVLWNKDLQRTHHFKHTK